MATEAEQEPRGLACAGAVHPARRWPLPALVAAAVLAADQLTKAVALSTLDGGRVVELGWTLQLRLVANTGSAFGLGSRYGPVIALVALAVVVVVALSTRALTSRWPRLGVGLVIGGALGNLADRAFRSGEGLLGGAVVDFVDLQWWPVFNLGDAAICVGAVLLALTARDGGGQGAPADA